MAKYLDLDAIAESVALTIKLGGKDHKMKKPTMKDLATVLKEAEELSLNATMSSEVETILKVLSRSFPTVDRDALEDLSPDQLRQLYQVVMEVLTGTVEKEDSEGNAPKAN